MGKDTQENMVVKYGEFSSKSVLSWYQTVEQMLCDVLDIVPYCSEHENVWSPKLVTILLETCSQLDSLWADEARRSPCIQKERYTIKDYFCYYGEYVNYRWVVFYGEQPYKIQPFEPWSEITQFTEHNYVSLDWWEVYNKLKHDRLNNCRNATMKHGVHALAALFLAILRCESCRDEIAQTGWLAGNSSRPELSLGEDSPSIANNYITAESKLFTYPVGWCKKKIEKSWLWPAPIAKVSPRFEKWFAEYEQEGQG